MAMTEEAWKSTHERIRHKIQSFVQNVFCTRATHGEQLDDEIENILEKTETRIKALYNSTDRCDLQSMEKNIDSIIEDQLNMLDVFEEASLVCIPHFISNNPEFIWEKYNLGERFEKELEERNEGMQLAKVFKKDFFEKDVSTQLRTLVSIKKMIDGGKLTHKVSPRYTINTFFDMVRPVIDKKREKFDKILRDARSDIGEDVRRIMKDSCDFQKPV